MRRRRSRAVSDGHESEADGDDSEATGDERGDEASGEGSDEQPRRRGPRRRALTDGGQAGAHMAADFAEHWHAVNERSVDDITLDFLYKPHSITLLAGVLLLLLYTALTSDDSDREANLWTAFRCMLLVFMVVSILAFPNGPFTRPHPAVWRVVFGVSVFYLMALVFALFQNFADVKAVLSWFDPDRLSSLSLNEKEYAINCSDVSFARVWSHMDVFAVSHFLGWVFKAVLIRHTVVCWYISVTWEITEIFFSHLLPNFMECWWDAILLDIVLCNGLGIWVGMIICHKLEMRTFHWESIKHIRGARGKLKRAVMQFTPASWTRVRWMDPKSSLWRTFALWLIVVIWQTSELNTFFLKHIFAVDTAHPIVLYRVLLIGLAGAPAIRQYYIYVTDKKCKRMGTQCWIYAAIVLSESMICVKFGRGIFAQAQLLQLGAWLVLLMVGSVPCIFVSMFFAKRSSVTREVHVNGRSVHSYLDSSAENISGITTKSTLKRRRRQR